jgi:AbiTii
MLLDEIIGLLGDEQASLTGALLKTKILLHQIGKKELVEWVNSELNGYSEGADVPPYRIVPSTVLANLANMAMRYSSHPIPIGHLKPERQESLEHSTMVQSLAVLEGLVSSSTETSLARNLPMELNAVLGKSLGNGFRVERAWCTISTHDIKGIFAQVRSRLLDFLLELKDTIGDTANESDLKEKTSSVDANSMFNNAVFGPNATILVGHQSSITATQTISGGELAEGVRALVAQLEKLLPTSELPALVQTDSRSVLAELREASAAPTPDVGRLRHGLESLKHVMEHAAGHLVATGVLATIGELLSRAAH